MKFNLVAKYFLRFAFLQITISIFTIWYFDKYVFITEITKYETYLKIVEDRNRFYNLIPLNWVRVDLILVLLITLFLILLYSSKFYTYVNELDFKNNNNFIDDYVILYFIWNSYLFTVLYLLRITGLSRAYLILYSILIPLILFLFRNSEILSNLLGRKPSKENFISFNLSEFSNLKNLRIITNRNELKTIDCKESELTKVVINEVDKSNKINNLNLIIIKLHKIKKLSIDLEKYLINLNKKVLIISDQDLQFSTNFIYRVVEIDSKLIYYFNNDVQYGAKYIIKRALDIIISIILLIVLSPLLTTSYFIVLYFASKPVLIRQNRVGLHGKKFFMYKFRTMHDNSHKMRESLNSRNKKTGPLFKIEDDPRIISNLGFLRKYSLDELPQIFNVLKGEMSLVGPRPLFEEDTLTFDKNYMRRLNVLPGMTGLLQINERNTDNFEIWYKYDIEYIENWSIYLDLKILFKTFFVLINNKNSGL